MKIIIALIILTLPVFSQFSNDQGIEGIMMEDKLDDFKNFDELSKTSVPFSTRIDPDIYYPGPGDIFQFKLLPYQNKAEFIVVDPEGNLILPRNYGIVSTNDKTLTEVREEIKILINESQSSSTVILSLYKPRMVLVKVIGNIPTPGVVTLPAIMTVRDVINYANNFNEQLIMSKSSQLEDFNDYVNEQFQSDLKINTGYPRNNIFEERNIILSNKSKSRVLDVASADFTDKTQNPFIREGDIINIPKMETNKNFYSVVGAVFNPSNIAHRNGDNVSLALNLVGGIRNNADTDNCYLFFNDGSKLKLSFNENRELIGDNPEIKSGATIVINEEKEETSDENGIVTLVGEFQNPGTYIIKNGETTLKQVIEMAGGVKSEACLNLGKILNLKEFGDKDFVTGQNEMQKLKYFNLTLEDTTAINLEYRLQKPYVSVDFEKAINSDNYNIKLKDGDQLELPKCPTRVRVWGRVNHPGYVEFEAGKHPEWFVNMAGGYVESADKKRLQIIRGGSGMWIKVDEETIVLPGDEVYIPAEPLVSKQIETQEYAAIAAIAGAIGAIGGFLVNILWFVNSTQ
jgi:protein involved in polysaccharide export with SLBB domain